MPLNQFIPLKHQQADESGARWPCQCVERERKKERGRVKKREGDLLHCFVPRAPFPKCTQSPAPPSHRWGGLRMGECMDPGSRGKDVGLQLQTVAANMAGRRSQRMTFLLVTSRCRQTSWLTESRWLEHLKEALTRFSC